MEGDRLLYRIISTEVLLDTIPDKPIPEAYIWLPDIHDFSVSILRVDNEHFKFIVSPFLLARPDFISSMNMCRDDNTRPSIKDTYSQFRTITEFDVSIEEESNDELAFEMINKSIGYFNHLLELKATPFTLDRTYVMPSYDYCLSKLEEGRNKIS